MARNGHILIVEDEAVNAAMIEHQLAKLGYSVAGIVGTGLEAIALAEAKRPDLVLMDIGLEGSMDGIEAAGIIHGRFEIPVVYLTTNSDEITLERARSTDAYGYLHKPIQGPALHSTIQIALSKAAMELGIREERKWLVTTLRCLRDGVIATDSIGSVKLMNPAAEAMTGWIESEALNRDVAQVFQVLEPETREVPVSAVTCIMSRGIDGIRSERLLVARDKRELLVDETAAAITNERGVTTGIVLVFHPVDGHKL